MSDENKPAEPDQKPAEPTALEKRLSSIIGAQKDLVQDVQNKSADIGELKQLVAALSQKVDGALTKADAPRATEPGNFFSGGPAQPAPDSTDFQTAVKNAVNEVLSPLRDEQTQQTQRLEKHRASFLKVVEQDNAFADPSSRSRILFDQIYAAQPELQRLDNAPQIIAEMVHGLTADERIEAMDKDLAKARATMPASGGRGRTAESDPDKVREMFQQLHTKGSSQAELSPKELGDYINLACAVAHLDAGV